MTAVDYAIFLERRLGWRRKPNHAASWRARLYQIVTVELEKQQRIDKAAMGTREH